MNACAHRSLSLGMPWGAPPPVGGRGVNKRCEEACTRGTIDQAVAIDAVKKFLAEQDLHAETRYIPPVVVASSRLTGWDQKIAIIGAGYGYSSPGETPQPIEPAGNTPKRCPRAKFSEPL